MSPHFSAGGTIRCSPAVLTVREWYLCVCDCEIGSRAINLSLAARTHHRHWKSHTHSHRHTHTHTCLYCVWNHWWCHCAPLCLNVFMMIECVCGVCGTHACLLNHVSVYACMLVCMIECLGCLSLYPASHHPHGTTLQASPGEVHSTLLTAVEGKP